jgi:hypothetical protein
MTILILGLTAIFNSYIIPTEIILRLLHGIKTDIKGILSWTKIEPKKEIIMKTLKQMETKVQLEGTPLSEEDINKLNVIQHQTEEIM